MFSYVGMARVGEQRAWETSPIIERGINRGINNRSAPHTGGLDMPRKIFLTRFTPKPD